MKQKYRAVTPMGVTLAEVEVDTNMHEDDIYELISEKVEENLTVLNSDLRPDWDLEECEKSI